MDYGKRPLWQWVLIYLIIGGIIYAAVYYFILAKKGGSTSIYQAPTSTPSTQQSPSTAPNTNTPSIPRY